jgi:uncharacterized membrane protein
VRQTRHQVVENEAASLAPESRALRENLDAIREWERAALASRSRVERLSDRITRVVAGGPALMLHVLWYAGWLVVNSGLLPGVPIFDPFPFPLLTTAVSLEAIFLSLFVLASQNRLAQQSDKRAHLDLQIDLLAEREMTAVLQILQDLAKHFDVEVTVRPEQVGDLARETDVPGLAVRVDEEALPGCAPPSTGPSKSR